jgi:uncharacterized protein (TIGR03435 family)
MIKQLSLTLTILATAAAQGPGGPPPRESGPPAKEFEVASIKPLDAGDASSLRVSIAMQPGGRFTASGVNASFLIQQAYNVREFQITGGPSWIRDDRYQINAKPDGAVNGREGMRPLFEKLLADRFKLLITRETKEMPIYKLVVNKGGVKMKENPDASGPGSGQVRVGLGQITGNGMDMGMLARQLGQQLGRLVIDETGLKGAYDFTLNFTPEGAVAVRGPDGGGDGPTAPVDGAAPSIFSAVQELGLKLESTKGPVEVVVITRIEKPTEN